jgi:hypothetical protein
MLLCINVTVLAKAHLELVSSLEISYNPYISEREKTEPREAQVTYKRSYSTYQCQGKNSSVCSETGQETREARPDLRHCHYCLPDVT